MDEQGKHRESANQSGSSDHGSGIVGESEEGVGQVIPALMVSVLLLVAASWDGAFDLRYWAPLGILSLALLAALVLAGALSLPRRGPLRVALFAIWGLAAFTYLSAAWSESPAGAWEGAARTVLFAAAFTIAVAAGRGPARRRLGDLLVAGVVAIAVVTVLRLLLEGADLLVAGRLNPPIGYRNGTAALFAFAAWPLLGIAARRGVQSGIRAAALAATVLVLGLAFLAQSRGVVLGLAAGGLISILIGPDRIRRSWLAIAALAAIAAISGPLLAPFDAFDGGAGQAMDADVRGATLALLLLSASAFLAGLLLFVLDNGLRADLQARVRLRQLATAGLAVLALLAGGVAIGRVGDPVSYADGKLNEFTSLEADTTGAAGTRLGTVGGQRYDLYRIAWDQFLKQPLAGAGEGSYPFSYYRERRTDRNLDNPHSLPLRMLAETGVAGMALFAAWLVGIGLAIGRRARTAAAPERVWLAGLAAAGTTVLVQSFVDWLWLLPALFGLAVLALGFAAGGDGTADAEGARPVTGRWSGARVAAVLGLGLALASVTVLFLSDLYVRKARGEALRAPQASLDAARMAERLNPLAVEPLYLQAGALETQGERPAARAALSDALEEEPRNFVTLALLGDLEVRAGRERRARVYYRAALMLNPHDVGLRELSRRR
jgi:O-antigen ligase